MLVNFSQTLLRRKITLLILPRLRFVTSVASSKKASCSYSSWISSRAIDLISLSKI